MRRAIFKGGHARWQRQQTLQQTRGGGNSKRSICGAASPAAAREPGPWPQFPHLEAQGKRRLPKRRGRDHCPLALSAARPPSPRGLSPLPQNSASLGFNLSLSPSPCPRRKPEKSVLQTPWEAEGARGWAWERRAAAALWWPWGNARQVA